MAFLGILVPSNIGNLLSQIDVSGEKSSVNELHITLMYFETLSDKDIVKAIDAIYSVVSQTSPFTVNTSEVSHFPGWEDNDKCAIIAKVKSEALHDFRQKIADALDKYNVDFSKTYKEYKPHITLSYSETEPKDFKFTEMDFTVSEIILWCGEEMNDKLVITFPLPLDKNAQLIKRVNQFYKLARSNMSVQQARKMLNLPLRFDPKELKRVTKQHAAKHHPDRGGDAAKFRQVMEAYEVLSTSTPQVDTYIPWADPITPSTTDNVKPEAPAPKPNMGPKSENKIPIEETPAQRDWSKSPWGDWHEKYK